VERVATLSTTTEAVSRSPALKLYWLVGHEKLDFTKPSTWWFFGKRFSGKSSGAEMVTAKHVDAGATAFDLFAARDNENLAWCRSPFKDVYLVCGDNAKLVTDFPWCKSSEFVLREAEKHEIVVTCPGFYLRNEYLQYSTLSKMVDILKWRDEWDKLDCLVVREASRLIASRIYAGKVSNRIEAEYDFIDLHNEAYHTGVTAAIDSLRPVSIATDVREIANYTVMKRLGKMRIPKEFNYLMRYIDPTYMRRMPPGEFILYTDNDDLAIGKFDEIPWHVKRGENILKSLNIQVEEDPNWQKGELQEKLKEQGREPAVTKDIHDRMDEMRKGGASYRDIQRETGFSLETIFKHLKGRCSCYAGVT
jgi:hypothetical protein